MTQNDGPSQVAAVGMSSELVSDARLRRIERDHAVLGALGFVAGLVLASLPEALSFALGWGVIASSLWVWKRVALVLFAGGPDVSMTFGVRLAAKSLLTLGVVLAIVPFLTIEIIPMLLGGAVFPAVLLIEAMRSGFGVATPAPSREPAA